MKICLLIFIAFALYLIFKVKEAFANLPWPQKAPFQSNTVAMKAEYAKQCSAYNVPQDPSKLQNYPYNFSSDDFLPSGQCPDSTFTYTTNLSRVIPGAPPIPSCVQLKDEPFCYSTPDGKFQPWEAKAMHVAL